MFSAMRGLANAPWPFVFDTLAVSNYTTNIDGTATLTTSATTHTKTAWTQLFSSTTSRTGLLCLNVQQSSLTASDNSLLLDIGTGASGGETSVVSNLALGGALSAGAAYTGITIFIPILIASGTRVAIRAQSALASRNITVHMALYNLRSAPMLSTNVDVIGTSTGTSAGTVMSGSSGTWVQITGSTSRAYRALLIVPSVGSTNMTTVHTDMDIGFGSAGSETSLGTFPMFFRNNEQAGTLIQAPILPVACNVAAGSRLAVRHRLATNPSSAAVCLIGIP
jgi:hypothetical protein